MKDPRKVTISVSTSWVWKCPDCKSSYEVEPSESLPIEFSVPLKCTDCGHEFETYKLEY